MFPTTYPNPAQYHVAVVEPGTGTRQGERPGVLRVRFQPQRVGFVELIFDVVFVLAFNQLSQRLADDLSWRGLWQAP